MQTSIENSVVGIDKKIPFIEKLLFPLTGGLGTFYLQMISTWLLFFYTDIMKLNVAYIGGLFVVVRILDAALTPVFGAYLDRQNTRWGKYKPWILIIWVAMAVGGFLTFSPAHFGQLGNTIYATITYTLFSLFLSMNMAPGTGMNAAMTKRQDDRVMMSVFGYVWVMVFAIIVSVGSLPLVNLLGKGNQGDGFRTFMLIAMVVGVIFAILIVKISKERFILDAQGSEKLDVKLIIEALVKNKYAVINVTLFFGINLFNYIRQTIAIYYYKYYFEDTNMMVLMGMISLLPTMIGVIFSAPITKKIGLKNNVLIMVVVTIVSSILMFFLPATSTGKIGFYVLSILIAFVTGLAQPAQGVMTPVSVDYGEWKFNKNSGGFFGAINGFAQTLATAVSGGITALILMIVNYVPDVQQTTASLNGIKLMMSIIPAFVFLLALVILKWDITEEKHTAIVKELNERRNGNTVNELSEDHL